MEWKGNTAEIEILKLKKASRRIQEKNWILKREASCLKLPFRIRVVMIKRKWSKCFFVVCEYEKNYQEYYYILDDRDHIYFQIIVGENQDIFLKSKINGEFKVFKIGKVQQGKFQPDHLVF